MALTSTISNVVKDPSGAALVGVPVSVTLMPAGGFRVDDATEVARAYNTVTDGSGSWSIALERNSNITPSNTTYEVVELIPAANGGLRVTTIQVGASNQTLLAAQVATPPAAAQSAFLTQAAADARYQALGSLGSGTPVIDSQTAGTAGASTAASRDSHQHQQATATPRGTMGTPGRVTANQGSITTAVDLTSLTTTFTAVSGRRYKVTGHAMFQSTVADDIAIMTIMEGATQLQQGDSLCRPAALAITNHAEVVLACPADITAAAHTYKLQAARSGTGTVTMVAAATFPAFILVEDIGT